MEKKQVIVTVSGEPASGKSRIAYIIAQRLAGLGLEVTVEPTADHPTTENFDNQMKQNLPEVIEAFAKTRSITVREVCTQKEPKTNG